MERAQQGIGVMADLTAYPIIFSGPMVCALLDGRKLQTRRLAWTEFEPDVAGNYLGRPHTFNNATNKFYRPSLWQKRFDKFHAGERPWLYVREPWSANLDISEAAKGGCQWWYFVKYTSDGGVMTWPQGNPSPKLLPKDEPDVYHYEINRPSIHMPKWASRLSLRVTGMRIERLAEISETDAIAEGMGIFPPSMSAGKRFREVWDLLHDSGAYSTNPEIVVITFKAYQKNIEGIDHDCS